MRRIVIALMLMMPMQSMADDVVDRVLDQVVLPGMADFASRADDLAKAAMIDCSPQNSALLSAWNAAMDAWFGIQDLRFGPLEDGARRPAIAYWPDTKGHRPRALAKILSGQDPILKTPGSYKDEAVSVRGLYAIEAMLFDPDLNTYTATDRGCALVRAASADMAKTAVEINADWLNSFASEMRTAGDAKNTRFLDIREARQVLFTSLMTSIQFDIEQRLGQPLGTYEKPRPLRAEGRVSGRAQRNLELSLAAHERLASAMMPEPFVTSAERPDFTRVREMASQLDDPDFAGVMDPRSRFKLEALQTALTLLSGKLASELGTALNASTGLNSLDGD